MSKKVQDFVQQVNKQNFSAAKGSFESAIAEKISVAFENKKIEIASQMTEGTMFSESKQRPIKFFGKTFTDYKVFNSDREANNFLEKNDDYGVIGEKGGKVYVAKKSDLGESKKDSLSEACVSMVTESQMISNWLVKDFEKRAENERRAGGMVDIDYRLPTVAVELSDGSEYFFQEYEAQDLIDEVPENISPEDYILAQAQGW